MSYDAGGNMLTRTITDTVLAKSRTWTYTYNANGQPLTMDGPRTDVSDITTYTYYANNDADHGKAGNLASITNAQGQITQITTYNAHGQPLTIVDPNGLATTLTYDPRMRLTSRTVGGETTSYTYDGVGQLTKVTLPDGSFMTYFYDAAHRLTQIADSVGNKIVYTLDLVGNRVKEEVFDPSNILAQTRSRVYNSLSRLTQEIGAAGQTTTYAYDNQGNLTSIDGPLPGTVDVTTNGYDALNRLVTMTDPNSGQVNYGYNAIDQMTSVKDPRNLTTSYAYDALSNLNQLTSPDTGSTQNSYDSAGNLLTQIDAKGQTTSYTYDALNRVTSISYATDPTLNVSFTYDQGVNGLGRLTGVSDSTGTISYVYEIHGRLATETRVIGGVSYTTAYSYDSAGRLASMTYPSGRQIVYARDGLGRVSGITTTKNSITQTLLTGVAYRPFGPEQAFTFGNSQTYTRGFDQDGRIAAYSQPGQTLAVGYDAASRITAITDTVTPSNVLTYNYDVLDRLTNFTAPALSLNQAFGYDAVGNRTSQTIGANSYANTYASTSNRIASSSGPVAKAYAFDANGSITNDAVNQYTFDARGRLKQATTTAGISQYLVNTMGQRVKKNVAGVDTVFHYDSGGRLISETDLQGNVIQEYVYLNDIPLAVLK
jgi:YD repeat-containing protein